jgi:hypothetical protein
MKVNIELNSKELFLLKSGEKPVGINFKIDVYTEASEVDKQDEKVIFTGLFWALCNMLPVVVVQEVFKQWNKIVENLHKGVEEGKTLKVKPPTEN